jgi:hypothetical protein
MVLFMSTCQVAGITLYVWVHVFNQPWIEKHLKKKSNIYIEHIDFSFVIIS